VVLEENIVVTGGNSKMKKGLHHYVQEKVETFREQNNIEPARCISDKILLYLRYGIDKIQNQDYYKWISEETYNNNNDNNKEDKYRVIRRKDQDNKFLPRSAEVFVAYKMDDEDKQVLYDRCMEFYKVVRGDMRYTNRNPLMTAAAMIYIIGAGNVFSVPISQREVSKILEIAEVTLRVHYIALLKDFKADISKLSLKRLQTFYR
jgi:hypothetical protein